MTTCTFSAAPSSAAMLKVLTKGTRLSSNTLRGATVGGSCVQNGGERRQRWLWQSRAAIGSPPARVDLVANHVNIAVSKEGYNLPESARVVQPAGGVAR